jgi:hypothetical protein
MTDIVDRLCQYIVHACLHPRARIAANDATQIAMVRDAAAEIERLRAENESLRRALDVVPGTPTEKDIEWARAAVEPKP